MSLKTLSHPPVGRPFRWVIDRTVATVRWLGFWSAIFLPAAYVAVPFLALGYPTELVLASVLCVHTGALLVGHGHGGRADGASVAHDSSTDDGTMERGVGT